MDAAARDVIEAAGHGRTSATAPVTASASPRTSCPPWAVAPAEEALPSPTVFSVEPGVYLDGVTGVRIEDLVAIDTAAGRVELLTGFPARSASSAPDGGPRVAPLESAVAAGRRPADSPAQRRHTTHMISTGDLRKGIAIELDGELWQILDYHHIKMGADRRRCASSSAT